MTFYFTIMFLVSMALNCPPTNLQSILSQIRDLLCLERHIQQLQRIPISVGLFISVSFCYSSKTSCAIIKQNLLYLEVIDLAWKTILKTLHEWSCLYFFSASWYMLLLNSLAQFTEPCWFSQVKEPSYHYRRCWSVDPFSLSHDLSPKCMGTQVRSSLGPLKP